MKKLIAILVVFAVVAGAALFAQDEGSWSVGGSGRIGASVNFLPIERKDGTSPVGINHAGVWADGWDQSRDNVRGNLDVNYKKGGLTTGLGFNQDGGITAKVSYNGDNWQFNAEQNVKKLVGTASGGRDSLWGNFTFNVLNGIKLEASVSRTGQQWWNATDIFGDTFTHTKWGNSSGTSVGTAFSVDGGLNSASYLLLDASPMAGLNLGFALPNVFVYNNNADSATADFLTDALQYTVFGGKFVSGPLQAAIQFGLKGAQAVFYDKDWKVTNGGGDLRSALYIGATYQINSEMRAGLEFRGLFGTQTLVDEHGKAKVVGTDVAIGTDLSAAKLEFKSSMGIFFGATFNFTQGPFGVGARLRFYEPNTAVVRDQYLQVRLQPYYNVVDSFLRVQLTAELTFKQVVEKYDGTMPVHASVMDYAIQPEIYFNFLGTGAGSWGTGFATRYRWQGPAGYFDPNKGGNTANFLELVFNWSF